MVINYHLKHKLPRGVSIAIYDGSVLINELKDPGNEGLNRVVWGMTKRGRRRTPEEIVRYDKAVAQGESEPFYDYYETVDFYGDPDEREQCHLDKMVLAYVKR